MNIASYISPLIVAEGVVDKVISKKGGGVIFLWDTDSDTSEVVQVPFNILSVIPERGEVWRVMGAEKDTNWGVQLIATDAARILPSGDVFIQFVSSNPRFKEIKKGRAEKLWQTHGYDIYTLLKNGDVTTISKSTSIPVTVIQQLCESWSEYQNESDVIEWLHKHKVPTRIAFKIVSCYKNDAVEMLEENPYRLVYFLKWDEVDLLARKSMGISNDDDRRVVAAVESIMLERWVRDGHTAIDHETLKIALNCKAKLANVVNPEMVIKLAIEKNSILKLENNLYQTLGAEALEWVMKDFINRANKNYTESFFDQFNEGRLDEFQKIISKTSGSIFKLNKEQRDAVKIVLNNKFACITGGAGVGKTTVLKAIYDQIDSSESIIQAALTNKAKMRMTEATGLDAISIAKLLTISEADNMSENCWLFIDESSMIDLPMFVRLVRSLPGSTRVYLIGDSHQLPPIGPGLVFHLAVQSKSVPTVVLKEVHRAALHTGIPQASLKIRNQEMPDFDSKEDAIKKEYGLSIVDAGTNIENQISQTLSFYRRFIEKDDVQIIAGTNRTCGIINESLHKEYIDYLKEEDEDVKTIIIKTKEISVGEPIVWLNENDHNRELYNGTMGVLVNVYDEPMPYTTDDGKRVEFVAIAEFDGCGRIELTECDLTNLSLAYAITCHKAQGSQWTRVIVCVDYSPIILDNSWIYTSVTRTSKQCVIIGNHKYIKSLIESTPKSHNRCIGVEL